jgi:hypothetical protein
MSLLTSSKDQTHHLNNLVANPELGDISTSIKRQRRRPRKVLAVFRRQAYPSKKGKRAKL